MIQQIKGRPLNNIAGKRFGKLIAIEKVSTPNTNSGGYYWNCLCDCGNYKKVRVGHLTTGNVKSCGCLSKLPNGKAAFNAMYYRYGYDASRRGYSFELTKDQFKKLTSQNCHYCNTKPETEFCHCNYLTPYICNGIDRKDNSKGYSLDNCLPCCGRCNRMKMEDNYEEFLERIKSIHQFRIERKDNTAS